MNNEHCPGLCHAIVIACASLVATTPLFAQTAPPTNAGRELESTAPAPPIDSKKDADVLPRDATAPRGATAADGPTLMVKGFRLVGNAVFGDDVLLPLLRPWIGKQAGTDQLLDAAETVRNRYLDAGFFLTQVFVPAQDVPDGIVTLRVVEAHIGRTLAQVDTHRVGPAFVDGVMSQLPAGAAVTEQGVERPLLLLNDVPGVKVTSVLRPGAQTGEADLLVTVADDGRAVGGDAYVDNAGSKSTGTVRVGVDATANGLLGAGESWNLGGLVSEHDGLDLVRGGVTLPVGPLGTKATLDATYLNYKVTGAAFQQLDADGYAFVGSLLIQHPVIRSRNFNLFAVGSGDVTLVDDRQLGGAVHDRRDLYIGHLGTTGDFRDQVFGGALNTFTFTLNAGDNRTETAGVRSLDLSDIGHHTAGQFELVNGDAQRLQALTDVTSVMLSMRGQLAFKNLDTSQKSSLGGPHGVRAFAVGDGVGDDLFQGTVELRQRIPAWSILQAPFVLSAFVDGGRFKDWHRPIAGVDVDNTRTLGGYGIGLNVTRRDDFQFRLDVAERINKAGVPGSDDSRTRVWVSLQKWL